ncbi:MAG: hypothetical protein M1835_003787, partial [Candelina submexicana]
MVFASSWRQAWGVKYLIPAFGGTWYRREDLQRAVKHLLTQRGMDENVMLKEDITDCK